MDDKKFDEIMKEYVSSMPYNQEKDFEKLRAYSPKQKSFAKFKWSAIVALICVVLSLSIILPAVILKETEQIEKPVIQYYDNQSVTQQPVEKIEDLNSYGIIDYLYPKLNSDNRETYVLLAKDERDVIIGSRFEFGLNNDQFVKIDIDLHYKKFELQKYTSFFSDCINETKWSTITIKSFSNYDEFNETYITKIVFSDDKYSYYVVAESYELLEPIFILNYIY